MRVWRVCALVGLAALVAGSVALAQGGTLNGVVGPSDTISMSLASGAPLRQIDPGAYTVNVNDRSETHNFHLTGPGVNEFTDVEFIGTRTWNVTFREGMYSFNCDVHGSMFGTFTVGNPPTTPPPPPPPPVGTPAAKLSGTVGPGKVITLRRGLRAVTALKAGRYAITVRDLTAADNFHLTGPGGINRKTTVAGRATVTWTVTLRAGLYTFRSDTTPRLKKTFRVTP